MLKEIFLTDELVDNLRVIHKAKVSSKETFELIKINNDKDEVVMMPLSKRTLYDLYSLVGKNLKREFNKKLDEDLSKYRKYAELKDHDQYIEKRLDRILKNASDKKKVGVVRQYIQNLFPSNKVLTKEFNKYKLRFLMRNLFAEEQGLLDIHYIRSYLQNYSDIDIDFEKILIDSINDYTEMVSRKDGSHYPKITDNGTAQDYFTSIIYRSESYNHTSDGTPKGRIYYREMLNNDLIEFVKTSYTNTGWTTCLLYISAWFGIVLGEWCFNEISLFTCVYLMIVMMVLTICPLVSRRYRIIKRLKTAFQYENEILESISIEEHQTIVKWFQ